ncbi:MAG: SagB family peptide dehydrogenase, partial [Chlamydiales bacterium]
CLKRLEGAGASEEELIDLVLQNDASELPKFYYLLNLLKKNNCLSFTFSHKNTPLFTLHALTSRFQCEPQSFPEGEKIKLSKFALLRSDNDQFILETPLSPIRCELHGVEVLNLVHQLTKARLIQEIRSSLPEAVLKDLIALLLHAQILTLFSNEKKDHTFIQWEFHDLLFHTRSRLGRHNNPYGGVYPFKKEIPPLPASKLPLSNERIALFRPDIEKLKQEDRPFTKVLEERRSKRAHADKPINVDQLGEFLFRSARREELSHPNYKKQALPQEVSRRPYPGGGAIYELELYVVVNKCSGLKSGMYHYQPKEHALFLLDTSEGNRQALLNDAVGSTMSTTAPQILFVMTSRFLRMSWKYRSMAYAVTLKNAGALLQTFYLVATAMDLAPCAVGGGNSDLFTQTVGIPYLEETSICEFILGTEKC